MVLASYSAILCDFDLMVAFYTVDHSILIAHLRQCGYSKLVNRAIQILTL